jgi:hypothetical protein
MPAAAVAAPVARRSQPIARVFLTEWQVEEMVGIPVSTLRKMRSQRVGIPYVSLPRCIRYSREDVIDWMNAHKIQPGDKPIYPESRIGRPRKDGSKPDAATGVARAFVAARQKMGMKQ